MKKSTGLKRVGSCMFPIPYILASLLFLVCALTVLVVIVDLVLERRSCGHGSMGPIPQGPGVDDVPRFIGTPAVAKPLAPKDINMYILNFTLGMDLVLFDPDTIEVIDLYEVGVLRSQDWRSPAFRARGEPRGDFAHRVQRQERGIRQHHRPEQLQRS